jgi:hypothetical protein
MFYDVRVGRLYIGYTLTSRVILSFITCTGTVRWWNFKLVCVICAKWQYVHDKRKSGRPIYIVVLTGLGTFATVFQ